MTSSLSPKADFLKHHADLANLLSSHREDKWLHVALAYTIAELTTQGLSGKELKLFADTLLTLGEPTTEIPQLPVQKLESYDEGETERKK